MKVDNSASVDELRDQAEQVYPESELRFRELFNHISSGVAIYAARDEGADFVFMDINQAGLRIGGVTREEVIGRPVTEVFPGIMEMGLLEVFRRVWHTGVAESLPTVHYTDARLSHWYDNHVSKLPTGEIVAVYDDRTERKRGEIALRESEERFRTLAENLPDIIARFDRQHRHLFVNRQIEAVTGMPPHAFLHKTNKDLGMPEELVAYWEAELRRVFDTGRGATLEFSFNGVTGLRFFEARLIPESASDGTVHTVLCLNRDITDRKRDEERVQQQMDELRRWQAVTLGRETRILDLKREVNELLAAMGQPSRYPSAEEREDQIAVNAGGQGVIV